NKAPGGAARKLHTLATNDAGRGTRGVGVPGHVSVTIVFTRSGTFPEGAFRGDEQMAINPPLNRKLRMGLVGGGQGAFIGKVHSIAAVLDNRAALVAGALSSDPARAKASAPDYDIPAARAYGSYQEMIAAESKLPPE